MPGGAGETGRGQISVVLEMVVLILRAIINISCSKKATR